MVILDSNRNFMDWADESLGYLTSVSVNLVWTYTIVTEEQGHYEVIEEYPNGGQDVEWVVDVPEVGYWSAVYEDDGTAVDLDAYDGDCPLDGWSTDETYTYEWEYQLYTRYTDEEIAQMDKVEIDQKRLLEIGELQGRLRVTDYIIKEMSKYLNTDRDTLCEAAKRQMEIDAQRYVDIIQQRSNWRSYLNYLESFYMDI